VLRFVPKKHIIIPYLTNSAGVSCSLLFVSFHFISSSFFSIDVVVVAAAAAAAAAAVVSIYVRMTL
jgi:hypothetical protein